MDMSCHKADVDDHMADSCKHDSMTHLNKNSNILPSWKVQTKNTQFPSLF